MNIEKSIENIVAKCDNYIDPQLAICIIRDNCTMGSNNIGELKKYGIENEDSYVEKVLKVIKHENIFITFGMLAFIPMFNECDIFSIEDKTISLSSEEFQKYGDLKEEYFGILIKKNSNDFIIGSCDLCGCKIDSSFRQIKKSEDNFYKTMHRNLNNFLKIFKYSSIFNNNVIILFDIESKFLLIKRTISIYCKNNLEFFYF